MNRKTNGYAARIMAAALATALLALGGCTGGAERREEPTDLVWPLPPDPPRIQYVRSISTKEDIGAQGKTSVMGSLFGEEDSSPVERMIMPFSVHAGKDGRIFVADTAMTKLLVFDEATHKLDIWGTTGQGVLTQPFGVTTDSEGRVYVTDGNQKRVVVYDREGEFLFAAGKKGELERPVGIVVNETLGRIYVADVKAHHIAVFDMQGNLVSTIGERGTKPGQFNFPLNLAIDRVGRLYVLDSMNFRVQILDPEGSVLTTFGEQGKSPGYFARPKAIAVDLAGNIYVVDGAFANVQIFDYEGRLLLYVGGVGTQPGQFYLPTGAYMDDQGRLYIADQYNSRVQIFQYLDEPKEQASPESTPDETSTESPPQ
jgi:DNA-binding beta-propeller fold protein YncE